MIPKVLVVDHSKVTIKQYTEVLSNLGAEVYWESDGHSALGVLLKENFDCLITLENIPFINGTNLIKILKMLESSNKLIPTILIHDDAEKKKSMADYNLENNKGLLDNIELSYIKIFKDAFNSNPNMGNPPPLPID